MRHKQLISQQMTKNILDWTRGGKTAPTIKSIEMWKISGDIFLTPSKAGWKIALALHLSSSGKDTWSIIGDTDLTLSLNTKGKPSLKATGRRRKK